MLGINVQGTAICTWSTNSFIGERVHESNSQLHDTDPRLLVQCFREDCMSAKPMNTIKAVNLFPKLIHCPGTLAEDPTTAS